MEKIRAKYMISQKSPKLLSLLLDNIRINKTYMTSDIASKLADIGILQVRDPILLNELIDVLADFGILDRADDKSFALNKVGNDLKSIYLRDRGLFFEIYHLMKYYAFELNKGEYAYLPFKSYQMLCRLLCNGSLKNNKQIADEIDSFISNTYNVIGSFSDACITRGLLWLYELQPSIVNSEQKEIVKRDRVISQAFIFNISLYYKYKNVNVRDPMFIDSETKRNICLPLFLSEDHFLEMLDTVCDKYPNHIDKKYNISGTYIILKTDINFRDLK
jgi:hypothetical protein